MYLRPFEVIRENYHEHQNQQKQKKRKRQITSESSLPTQMCRQLSSLLKTLEFKKEKKKKSQLNLMEKLLMMRFLEHTCLIQHEQHTNKAEVNVIALKLLDMKGFFSI